MDDEESNHASIDEEDSLAELDHILVEQAGDLLPSFAEAIGGESFKKYFNIILPEILKKSVSSKLNALFIYCISLLISKYLSRK